MDCFQKPNDRHTGTIELCRVKIPLENRKGQYIRSGMFLISGPKNGFLIMDMRNTLVIICNAKNFCLFLQAQHHAAVKNVARSDPIA